MTTKVTDIQARIGASVGGFEASMKTAAASASIFERELAKLEVQQRQMATWEAAAYREEAVRSRARVDAQAKVGRAFLASGAAIGLGIGLAVKAAMDWQTAMAGLEKTLPAGTSGGAIGVLDAQLRSLSKTIPVGAEELAGLAATASQLGVGQQYLAAFTRTAADLGQVTTLSAEDAVTGLAKLGNVMEPGKFAANIDRAGSALVALGSEGASTEQEILDMAERIAGAGKTVGMTEPQVMAVANALTSVGLDAEAGGTAISRTMVTIAQAVQGGGESLDQFARISGMSADQFRSRWQTNAAGALTSFIGGLGKLKASGGDAFGTLEKLGLSEVRVRDTLLRASSASDLLTQSLATGQQAWDDASALTDAAAARYGTAGAKMRIAGNELHDTAIDIGATFLPAVAGAAREVAGLISVFQDAPEPVKRTLAVLGGIGAAALTAGGAFLTLAPKIRTMLTTLEEAGPAGVRAATAMRSMGSALMGPLGIALALGTIALGNWLQKQAEAKANVDALTESVKADGNAIGTATRQYVAHQLAANGILEITRKLGYSQNDVLEATLGNADAQKRLTDALEQQKNGLSNHQMAISADGVAVDDTYGNILKLESAIKSQGGPLKKAISNAQDEASALGQTSVHASLASSAIDSMGQRTATAAGQVRIAKSALDDFNSALKEIFDTELGAEAAADAFTRGLQSVQDAAKAHAGGGAGKVSAADRQNAKDAYDKTKADAIAAGATKQAALAQAKAARDRVLAQARTATPGKGGSMDNDLDVRQAMRDEVQHGLDIIAEMAKQGASTDDMNAKSKELGKQIYDVGIKIGLSKKKAQEYSAALGDVPTVVRTAVNTAGLTEAMTLLQQIKLMTQWENSHSQAQVYGSGGGHYEGGTFVPNAPAKVPVSRSQLKGFASGTIATHPTAGVFGEAGAEALIPLSASHRAGSVALLRQAAHRFGMDVTRGKGTQVHVVRVPVQETHTDSRPVNIGPVTVVAASPSKFTDWAASSHAFGSGGVG